MLWPKGYGRGNERLAHLVEACENTGVPTA
jgi:hypothetical protein